MRPLRAVRACVWLTIAVGPVSAQQPSPTPPCDSRLLQLAAPVNGYQRRGDRCEGVYARQVAGTTLFLASFTETFEKYDLKSDAPLLVRWPMRPDSGIQLRAETVRAGRYYRMDTRAAPQDSVFTWPSRILSSERLNRGDLGVLGWTRLTIGGQRRIVYLPLAITQQGAPKRCNPLELVLSTETRLSEVTISLAQIDSTGAELRAIKQNEPLGRGFYPAGSPIVVTLKRTDLAAPGLYSLKIAATLSPRGDYANQYFLLIPPGSGC